MLWAVDDLQHASEERFLGSLDLGVASVVDGLVLHPDDLCEWLGERVVLHDTMRLDGAVQTQSLEQVFSHIERRDVAHQQVTGLVVHSEHAHAALL